MAVKPENTFIQGVHKHLPLAVYHLKNSNQFNAGIADCWYSGRADDLWVEYKYLEVPKRPDTMIDLTDTKKPYSLTALQQQWLKDRFEEGRNVGVIVGSKNGGIWLPGLAFVIPCSAQGFINALKTRRELAERIAERTHG